MSSARLMLSSASSSGRSPQAVSEPSVSLTTPQATSSRSAVTSWRRSLMPSVIVIPCSAASARI